ncbi:response regulator [Haloferula sp.]|uniref:response regulator n=1 Tax=Haloferula sp. TaxID=2497595 RepID=UPI003C771ADD
MSDQAPSPTISILLVDDHFIVRMGLSASLEEEPDLHVIGEASTIAEALTLFEKQQPDVGIIDMRLPDGNGDELVATIRERYPSVRCLMLSVNQGESDIQQAVKAGAVGYLAKSVERTELLEAIRQIAAGESYFPEAIRREMARAQARPELSPREHEVLLLVAEGLLNKEIASELGLAEITVKQHVSAVLRKLGVQDRTQAAITAVERGIVRLGD